MIWGRHITLLMGLVSFGAGFAQTSPDSIAQHFINTVSIWGDPEIQTLRLDSNQLARHQTQPLADLLSEVPSVFIKSYGQSGISTPAFRGTGAGHTQVLWNGLPTNSPSLGLTDFSLGNTSLFEGVEILYGSRSLEYGEGALGGSIQLQNKPVHELYGPGNHLQIGQEVGSFGNYRTQFALGLRKKRWWASTKALYAQGENDFTFRDLSQSDRPTVTLEHSQLAQWTALQQIGWAKDDQQVTGRVWLNQMDRNLPSTILSNNLTESQADASVRAQLEWKLKRQYWRFESILGWGDASIDYQNVQANIFSLSRTRSLDGKFKAQQNGDHVSSRLLKRELGARLGYDFAESPGYTDRAALLRGTVFVNHQWRLFTKDRLELLVRESFNQDQWTLPFGSLTYLHSFHTNQAINIGVSRNERFPTLNDLFWVPGGNPDLEKETSYSGELGFQKRWRQYPTWEIKLETNLYSSLVDNWILWTPLVGNLWSPQNVQQVLTSGAEINLHTGFQIKNWDHHFRAGYAFNRSQSRRSNGSLAHAVGKQLIYTPQHTGFLSWQATRGKSFFSYSQQFTGIRYTSTDHTTSLPAFSLGDLRVGSQVRLGPHQLEFYGGIRNLWNTDYQAIAWRPMPGRNGYAGLRLHFNFNPS